MPHKCVRCGLMYGSGAEELFKGCGCGSRIFMFIKPDQITLKEQMDILERESKSMIAENREQLEQIAEIAPISIERAPSPVRIDLGEMSKPIKWSEMEKIEKETDEAKERTEIMQEASEILDTKLEGKANAQAAPVEKPVENITIVEKGRYELDLQSLMSGNPLVIKSEHGVFYIRIPTPVKKKVKKK
ncbi:MAG: Zn-ribbon containing protein [Candidatus Micrarchaeota archaeon]